MKEYIQENSGEKTTPGCEQQTLQKKPDSFWDRRKRKKEKQEDRKKNLIHKNNVTIS